MPSLHELIDLEHGVRTREREGGEDTTITSSASLILRNDSSRLAFIVINLGDSEVFIRPDRAPSATVGMRIGPNGGSLSMLWREDFSLVGKEFWAVAPVASATIYILEILIEPGSALE